MNIDDMGRAVVDAEATLARADSLSTRLARLLVGRLKKVTSPWLLRELKKELKDYNIHTQSWMR